MTKKPNPQPNIHQSEQWRTEQGGLVHPSHPHQLFEVWSLNKEGDPIFLGSARVKTWGYALVKVIDADRAKLLPGQKTRYSMAGLTYDGLPLYQSQKDAMADIKAQDRLDAERAAQHGNKS